VREQQIASAAEALDFIESMVAAGLAPVMKGTRFYRHSFSISQFGSYLYYLDERGTAGRCQFQNVESVFDFIDLGLPVPGSEPWQAVPERKPHLGHILVVETVGGEVPSLLEAASAALRAMDEAGIGGAVRDYLERAIAAQGRVH
jgi:hypothetical protein